MTVVEMIDEAVQGKVVQLTADDATALIDGAEVVRSDKTSLAGQIRTLRLDGRILIQERNSDHEHFIRVVDSEEAARRFVEKRLADYDRMWDG